MAKRGRFFVIDGVDGCGKSTQAGLLCAALRKEGRPEPLHLREPGSTRLGERLREILLASDLELSPAVETLLFAAARAQMLAELVEPALAAGRDVVCERFHPSTFGYQAVAGGLDEDQVLDLLHRWAGRPAPDLVILLDLDPAVAEGRRAERGAGARDRFEDRGADFQRKVAEGLRRYARRPEHRERGVVLVDGGGEPRAVAERVLAEVRRAL